MIPETSEQQIIQQLDEHRQYFASHKTLEINYRIEQLRRFKAAILLYEQRILDALWTDLHKSPQEAYLTEISMVLQEIDNHLKHLRQWTKPKRVPTPLHLLPSSSRIMQDPLGVALIMAPWNYPFQLLLNPLVGAISAGCCAVLKPSPSTPTVATLIEEMIAETFPAAYVSVVQGSKDTNIRLFEQRFDIIFFTGSPMLGKVVMKAAANYLTPVVLELGGKSPCIVDKDANIDIAAKRIAWGKLINAGQTCIAPDYLFAHESVKAELLKRIEHYVHKWYGKDPQKSEFFPRIVSQDAIERLKKLMQHGTIVMGGQVDEADRYIAPTIIDGVKADFPIMQEEIFGPILPVMTFGEMDEVFQYVNSHEKPLAFYYFGKSANAKDVLSKTTSGGACINDTLMHVTNHHLPFGGVGNSGLGKYHGHLSYLAFSNARPVVTTPAWIDLPVKYVPFRFFSWVKKLI